MIREHRLEYDGRLVSDTALAISGADCQCRGDVRRYWVQDAAQCELQDRVSFLARWPYNHRKGQCLGLGVEGASCGHWVCQGQVHALQIFQVSKEGQPDVLFFDVEPPGEGDLHPTVGQHVVLGFKGELQSIFISSILRDSPLH